MRQRLSFVLFQVLIMTSANSQDPHFSQFYANLLYLNPAFSGSDYCPRVILNYRNQWPGLTGDFVTYSFSYDQHIDLLNGGIGILVVNDRAGEGTLNTSTVNLAYAYTKSFRQRFTVKAAFQASCFQKYLDWNKLTFGDMIDPRYGFIYPTRELRAGSTKKFADFSSGIVAHNHRFYGGFAVHHLTQPDEGLLGPSVLPARYTIHAGALVPFRNKEGSSFSPNILFMQQQNFRQLNAGLYFTNGPMVIGCWYRADDAFILLIGLYRQQIKIGYSYDITLSKLSNTTTAGAHEISAKYRFNCGKKKPKPKEMDCPNPDF